MKKIPIIQLPFDGVILKALGIWNVVRTLRVLLGGA